MEILIIFALVGGAADAVESVGGFLDLSGDTIKTGLNKAFGNPIDETQNPWSNQYESNNPLDIPDEWIPENKSGLGKLARGLAEFGFLSLTSKCKCGPVDLPVFPTKAIISPCFTCCPFFTNIFSMCIYKVDTP